MSKTDTFVIDQRDAKISWVSHMHWWDDPNKDACTVCAEIRNAEREAKWQASKVVKVSP